MKPDLSMLPDNADQLKEMVASFQLDLEKSQEQIHYLQERIRLLQNENFGRSSEKHYRQDGRQLPIFEQDKTDQDVLQTDADHSIIVPAHKRKKRGRKPLPENLPRVEIIHDLDEEEKVCPCGAPLSRIGQDTCEKLDYVPARVRVLRHVRFKYACKACQGVEDDGPTVKIAPAPVQLIEKSMATEGLLAHIAVSKFTDVVKARKKNRGKRANNKKTLADEALDFIGKLYKIEKQARAHEMTPEQRYSLRQEKAKPILKSFEKWLEKTKPLTPPKGLLGKAISYALRNWDKLIVYIQDGRLNIDNNAAENAIRPFVLGRKNWLFAGAPNGAAAGAAFFSLIETAKANGLEPYAYLRCLFAQLPLVKEQSEYRDLLPQYIDPALIKASQPEPKVGIN